MKVTKDKTVIYFLQGGEVQGRNFFSLDHALEVHKESKEIQSDAWDCKFITTMKQNKDVVVNPIYHFTEQDIWEYIRQENIETNPLYQCGYDRVGCIGCPLAPYHKRVKEFSDYPKYKGLYIKAFEIMIRIRREKGKPNNLWNTGQDVFDWWIEEYKHNVKGQITLNDYLENNMRNENKT